MGKGRDGAHPTAGTVLIVLGALLVALGLTWIGMYAWGVIDVLDQPDRSWLFWGLALLFGGILLTRGGQKLITWGRALRGSVRAG